MNNNYSKILLIALLFVILYMAPVANAIKQLDMANIDTDKLAEEGQFVAPSDAEFFDFLWWIPLEFWKATYAIDESISEADEEEILNSLQPYSLIAIAQADISNIGAFNFYSKRDILSYLEITYTDKNGNRFNLKPIDSIDPNLEVLLGVFTPILSAAMGNLGQNMHFFVLDDINHFGERIISPYKQGNLEVVLRDNNKNIYNANLELPLNSLYIPRKCPNGKDAHVSWKYCPWTGKKLDE